MAHLGQKGWQTAVPLGHYLRWVGSRPRYAYGRRIVLPLDSHSPHSPHKSEEMLRIAKAWRIDLAGVPAGCTGALQPCDRYVFGAFRAICHHLRPGELGGHCSGTQFVSMLVWSWAALRCPRPSSARVRRASGHEGTDGCGDGDGSLDLTNACLFVACG
jgi:hypothetical protein